MAMRTVAAICLLGHGVSALIVGAPGYAGRSAGALFDTPGEDPGSVAEEPPATVFEEPADDEEPEPPGGDKAPLCQNCQGVQFTPEEQYELMKGTDPSLNICIRNHLVPELLVIGPISGGTTTFCSALEHSPGLDWPITPGRVYDRRVKPTRWKEGHYFDKWFYQGIELLINDYHECDTLVRKVGVEGSARYALDRRVPGRISWWYGVPIARKTKFVFILREPVDRFHSHYWKAIDKVWCVMVRAYSLKQVAKMAIKGEAGFLENGGDMGGCGDMLEAGYYTKQIKYWWEFYHPWQFVFVPFKLAMRIDTIPGVPPPHQFIWNMLGVRGKEPKPTYENGNSNKHPTLEVDLTEEQIIAFRAHLYKSDSPLQVGSLIAQSDAVLYGFQDEEQAWPGKRPGRRLTRSNDTVAAWLVQYW